MGVCQNIPRAKRDLRINAINNNSKYSTKYHNNIRLRNFDSYVQFPNPNTAKIIQETDLCSKKSSIYSNYKLDTTPSNISANSTCVQTNLLNRPQYFTIEATIGEIEIPIIVEKNEKIVIKINQNNDNNNNNFNNKNKTLPQNMWSFLKDEKPVNYLGYNNHKYKNINIAALHMRISRDKKIYLLDKSENIIIANERGNLLFFANLDLNDYMIYEPKGSISITIMGGSYYCDNDLYFSYNINCFSNKNNNFDSKEYKFLDYINKARNNLMKFYLDYYNINDLINQEFKEYIFNNYKNKRKEFKMNKELNDLAEKHCEDLCENETAGYTGSDGFDLIYRLKNNYKCYYFGETIIYNINNPLFIVKNMLQDKYSKKKKNRNNLFSNHFNQIGISLKEHPIYKYCCVIVFSE